ncbi:nitroreductase family protein [Pseudomonadota bacterium]
MNVSKAIETRRSIERFDPNHGISEAEVTELLEAAILSPTAFNIQHWRFVRVKDKALRERICESSWNQPQVTDASLLLFICMDFKAWQKSPERYWRNTPPEVAESMLRSMGYYADDSQAERDEGIRSASLACMTLMLKAKEMGYDSCPMLGFEYGKVAELINLPKDHGICLMLAIGKQLKPAYLRAGQLPLEELLMTDTF